MGLIRKHNNPNLSLAEKQQLTATAIRKSVNDLFRRMISVYEQNSGLIFENPYGLTKEEVLAGLGADAPELVRLGMLLKDCINLAQPGSIDGPPDEYN